MANKLEKFLKNVEIVDPIFKEMYEKMIEMPDDFDPTDPNRIEIFSARLREARKTAGKQTLAAAWSEQLHGNRDTYVTTLKDVANWLGVTEATVSYYETGKIKRIPMEHLILFFDLFDVTPHYLVGYTADKHKLLRKINGEFKKDELGNYKEYIDPITYPILSQKRAVNLLSRLGYLNCDWLLTLCKFLSTSDQTMNTGFEILKVLVENDHPRES